MSYTKIYINQDCVLVLANTIKTLMLAWSKKKKNGGGKERFVKVGRKWTTQIKFL